MVVCTDYELWLKLKGKWGKYNVLPTVQFPHVLRIAHTCRCEAGQQRESCHFVGLGASTVLNLSSTVVFWKLPLSLSSHEAVQWRTWWCVHLSLFCISHVTVFLKVEFCYREAWLWPRLNIKKTKYFLQSSTVSKPDFPICVPECSQNSLFCLYHACCSFRASTINWSWSQSWGSLCLHKTLVQ